MSNLISIPVQNHMVPEHHQVKPGTLPGVALEVLGISEVTLVISGTI